MAKLGTLSWCGNLGCCYVIVFIIICICALTWITSVEIEKSATILFLEAHATYISTSNFIPRSNAHRRGGGGDASRWRRSDGMIGCSGRSGGASALQDREKFSDNEYTHMYIAMKVFLPRMDI